MQSRPAMTGTHHAWNTKTRMDACPACLLRVATLFQIESKDRERARLSPGWLTKTGCCRCISLTGREEPIWLCCSRHLFLSRQRTFHSLSLSLYLSVDFEPQSVEDSRVISASKNSRNTGSLTLTRGRSIIVCDCHSLSKIRHEKPETLNYLNFCQNVG